MLIVHGMLRTNHILHHTIGLPNWTQEYRCFQEVTCHQVTLVLCTLTRTCVSDLLHSQSMAMKYADHYLPLIGPLQVQVSCLSDAHEQIDHAIAMALRQRLPVYINVCCNIAGGFPQEV